MLKKNQKISKCCINVLKCNDSLHIEQEEDIYITHCFLKNHTNCVNVILFQRNCENFVRIQWEEIIHSLVGVGLKVIQARTEVLT